MYKLSEDPQHFLSKLIKKAPQDLVSFKKLAGIGKVYYSDRPGMSAAVANTRPYSLIFGREFMEKNISSDEDAIFILFHELTHLVLDHFAHDVLELFADKGLLGSNTKTLFAKNCIHIIVDAQVNATCYYTLKDNKYNQFPINFYSFENRLKQYQEQVEKIKAEGGEIPDPPKDNMPYCFLHSEGEKECPTDKLKAAHKKLYSPEGITNSELIDLLLPWFQEHEKEVKEAVQQLLGNHKDMLSEKGDSQEGSSQADKDLVEGVCQDIEKSYDEQKALQEAQRGNKDDQKYSKEAAGHKELGDTEGNEKADKKGNQYSLGEHPVNLHIKRKKNHLNTGKEIAKILSKNYNLSPSGRLVRAIREFYPKTPVRTVVPNFRDSRTVSLYSTGVLPVFHKTPQLGIKTTVACYMDVSGSQDHVIPKVLEAVIQYKRYLGNEIYCFSTLVSPTSMLDMEKGNIYTTGGTDFNPVAEHILQNNFKSVIILTDGRACLNDKYVNSLKSKSVNITVGWTEFNKSNVSREPLLSILKKEFWLFGTNPSDDKE